jgi:hypothetical protein
VDATISGFTGHRRGLPRGQGLDGDLEEPDGGAERAGDEVQLVLDDEVRRAQPADRSDGRCRKPVLRRVRSDLARRVVSVDVAVPTAPPADVAEQCCGLPLAREPCELVDGGDDERGREAVDLLVDREDRQSLR